MSTTDLFGQPLGGYPAMALSLTQKRQAALLYYWMSLDYLKGLKAMIDALIRGADVNLELAQRQGRDAILTSERWGLRDTAANWATHVYPALEEFKQSTIKLTAWRTSESYCGTGANQCGRLLGEYSGRWMTQEEEEAFKAQFETVYRYASKIDDVCGAGGGKYLDDFSMSLHWQENKDLFARLPKFRVRTDVEAVTGKKPVRTGVYVAQDDPHATLQFAWTGNDDGILGKAVTFNELGLRALAYAGRAGLWLDGDKMAAFASKSFKRGEMNDRCGFDVGDENDPRWAPTIVAMQSFTERSCKWYFVEKVEGEYEDEAESEAALTVIQVQRLKIEGGQVCPKEGWYKTPALAQSRRYFRVGEVMPVAQGSDYGQTIWQRDDRQ